MVRASRRGPKVGTLLRTDVEVPLLGCLRETLGAPSLGYADPPVQITGGFDTTIFAFQLADAPPQRAGPLIVRIFREDAEPAQALFESAVQNAVAALGFPVPRVLITHPDREPLGAPFVIMERVRGRPMLDAIFGLGMPRMPTVLGRMHARLHALDAAAFVRMLEDAGVSAEAISLRYDPIGVRRRIEDAALDGLRPGLQWLDGHRPAGSRTPSICHGDFHPINVLIDGREISGVIDWSWVCVGDAECDVGATLALFTQGPIDLPGWLLGAVGVVRRWLARRYLRAYTDLRPLDMQAVRYYEALHCLGFLVEAGEHQQAVAGIVPPIDKLTAFGAPRTISGIKRRFAQITGLELTLPNG